MVIGMKSTVESPVSGKPWATFEKKTETECNMSQHASLKAASKIATRRNVLKRYERIDILKQRGRWKDGDRGLGLPKTKLE